MYSIFTGSSDRMLFQVISLETAFVGSAHPLLGAHWDWIQEERCMKMITLCNVMPCGLAVVSLHRTLLFSSCTLMVAESVSSNNDISVPDYMASHTRRLWSSLDCQTSQDAGSSPPPCTSPRMGGLSNQGVGHGRSWDVCCWETETQCLISFVIKVGHYRNMLTKKAIMICCNLTLWAWGEGGG
jgi:hypothetical protein